MKYRSVGIVAVACMLAGACSNGPGPSDASDSGGVDVQDAVADAPIGSFIAMLSVNALSQNCMPVVANDPLTFMGTLMINNTGSTPIGPITASSAVVTVSGSDVATFTIDALTIPEIAPGATGMAAVNKQANTLMPANGCSAVPCGMALRVQLPISGAGVPVGARASSELVVATCSM